MSVSKNQRLEKMEEIPETINLASKLATFDSYWDPRIVAELNGQMVKLAKLKGEFIWHAHENEDEMFMVLDGQLTIEFREPPYSRTLEAGDIIVVPKGIEHRPVAREEVHVLLFEPASTINTGTIVNERTKKNLNRI